jgi:hypothetical protein
MKKAYLFIYSDSVGDRETVKGWLNEMSEIIHWRFDLPNTFYLISESSADELSGKVLEYTDKKGRFLISEYSGNSQGWLPSEAWYLLNNKRHKPKDA